MESKTYVCQKCGRTVPDTLDVPGWIRLTAGVGAQMAIGVVDGQRRMAAVRALCPVDLCGVDCLVAWLGDVKLPQQPARPVPAG